MSVKLIAVVSLIVLGLSGCGAGTLLQPLPSGDLTAWAPLAPHQTEDRAKARLAFLEFRLYAANGHWDDALAALQRARQSDPDSSYLHLLLARVYLHLEQSDEAMALMTELLTAAPDHFEGHLLLGDIYLSQQHDERALTHFRRALVLRDDDEGVHLRLAMVLLRQEQVEKALTTLEDFLQQQPEAHQARLSLARIYRDQNRLDSAQQAYRSYLEYFPQKQQILVELGQLMKHRDPEAALRLYHQALTADPDAVLVRRQLAQLYLERQQPDAALQQLLTLRRLSPMAGDDFQIGLLRLRLEQWAAADKEFRSLLAQQEARQDIQNEIQSETDRPRYYLAMALIGRERYQEAIAQLTKIGHGSDLYPDAMLQLAYLYHQQQQSEQAFQLLGNLLQNNYRQPEVYYYLIAFHQDLGQEQQAYEVARAATERYPDDARLLYQLGVLLGSLEQPQQAHDAMKRVLEIDQQHADALNYLAYAQAETETDLPLALERASRALELKPAGYIEDTLGWIYFKLGDYDKSRIHLESANRMQPNDQVVLEHLGDLYVAMELYQDAAEAYQRVLELDADVDDVSVKLESLSPKLD